jgi:large repetitive protein
MLTVNNLPPTADAQSVQTNDGQAKTITLTGTDPASDALSFEITSLPQHGKIYDGSDTTAPDASYSGPDAFDFKADDGTDKSAAATVSITVVPFNDPPVANEGTETMSEDGAPINIDFGAPISDEETSDANLTYTVISGPTPQQGTLSGSGSIRTFDSADNFFGTVTLEYKVIDRGDPDACGTPGASCAAAKDSDTKTLNITVNPVNDAPVADDETFNGASRAVGNTSLVGNDPDDGAPDPSGPQKTISGDILSGDTDIDGPGPLVVQSGTFSTNDGGSVVIESDGDFTFHPKAGTSCTDTSDFLDYTVSDQNSTAKLGTAGTDTGRVTIEIQDCVWSVDSSLGSNGDGRSHSPFNSLSGINGAGGTGDADDASQKLFLYDGTYSGGLPLENIQTLLSERNGLVVPDGGSGNLTLVSAGGSNTTITGGLTLAQNNTIQGYRPWQRHRSSALWLFGGHGYHEHRDLRRDQQPERQGRGHLRRHAKHGLHRGVLNW